MSSDKILFVDDEENLLVGIQRLLRREFSIETALGPEQGLTALESGDGFAVVVADMKMPKMNGIEFLRRSRELAPDAVRLMLTGNADQRTAIDAVNDGAVFRFLTKPCSQEQLKAALNDALRQHRLLTVEKDLLDQTLRASIAMLSDIMASSDPATFSTAKHLRELARSLGEHLKLPHLWELETAASLAQIGLFTLPPSVRAGALGGNLKPAEKALLENVPRIGSRLVGQIPRFERIASAILYQRKNFDGTGFPDDDVAGLSIPTGGRLLRLLADLVELERHGMTFPAALQEMSRRSGWYDPDLLAAAKVFFKEIAEREAVPPASVPVTAKSIAAGNRLTADIYTIEGIPILLKGQLITEAHLQRLHNFASLGEVREPFYVEGPAGVTKPADVAGSKLKPTPKPQRLL